MRWGHWYKDVLLFTAMVAAEVLTVGLNTVFKAATKQGLSHYVYVAYSYAISTLVLLPLVFLFRSTAVFPSPKFPLLFRICLLGLIGSVANLLGYKGIELSSPTLASAMSNLTPAFTFILAVIFRMERLALRSFTTQAKVIGTIASISGALIVVLYKGPAVISASTLDPSVLHQLSLGSSQSFWVIGGLLQAIEYLLFSIWYIIQAQVLEIYPAELAVVLYYNICATIITAPICFIAEPNLSAWRLHSTLGIIAVIYSGLCGTCLVTIIHCWCLQLKGPVYVTIFKPVSIAIAALMSFIFLGDALYLGSVIGVIIISAGFYAVIWGKAKEEEEEAPTDVYSFRGSVPSSDTETPLLDCCIIHETQHK